MAGTLVCVASHHTSLAALVGDAEFERIRRDARCLIELRLDRCSDASVETLLSTLAHLGPKRCVVTCRHAAEGGGDCVPEAHRAGLLEAACKAGAAFVDVELRTLQADPALAARLRAASQGSRLVVSFHDFTSTPPVSQMRVICREAAAFGASVVKLAVQAQTVDDTATVLDLLCTSAVTVPVLAVAMGEVGLWTRLLAPRSGTRAPFGFARAHDASGTAPGQPAWEELLSMYRYHEQTAAWPVFGVIGSPIVHSRSPAWHNAALQAHKMRGVYVPFRIDDGEGLDIFMQRIAPRLGVRGLSITLPHKEAMLKHCLHASDLARSIGAVNTATITHDGSWLGENTDADAAIDALQSVVGELAGKQVVVLGAGGAAKAVAHGAQARGAHVLVCSRNTARAQALADAVAGKVIERSALGQLQNIVALIQTTPVGMHPLQDAAPLTAQELPPKAVIFDTIYNPAVTKLMELAAQAGHVTLGGESMFERQAAAQFKLFAKGTS